MALEGDNQKQADFLSRTLADCDPQRVHGLHMLIGSVSRPEHLDLFENGIAEKLDLAYAGPQSVRIAQLVEDGTVTIGAIHTYVELYARMFTDLTPDVALLCAEMADRNGNLYTGANTEDTPTIAEAAAFRDGVVLVQVNEIVDDAADLPRIDIPGGWVDLVVAADRPFAIEPLFTRDPRHIGDVEILQAMIALRGVYERHQVVSLNHGVGFDTAAIELILPTYGERLGLRGKIARNWTLNPHPTLIPAIESGWVESVHCFGGEPGMDRYTAARPDVFFTGSDGSLRSNRVLCQLAGQYAIDMFIGSSLQIDGEGNSSTVTDGRLSGFGGAPNMGHDPHGRRHASPAWLSLMHGEDPILRGRKLVVQIAQTFRSGGIPTFVETLDAVDFGKAAGMPIPPVMIYGDDVSHVVTEEGVAYLYKAPSLADRRDALAAIAGVTPIGRHMPTRKQTERLRRRRAGRVSRRSRGGGPAGQPLPARRPQHRRPGRLVRRAVRPAREVSGLVSAMLLAEPLDPALRDNPLLTSRAIADLAVAALRAEAELTPKPGLVDRRGSGAHTDMDLRHAVGTRPTRCTRASPNVRWQPSDLPPGHSTLRVRLGVIGRTGRAAHAGRPPAGSTPTAGPCGRWACWPPAPPRHRRRDTAPYDSPPPWPVLPTPRCGDPTADSHGARARRRYGASGAAGEAQAGFPHVVGHALPALRAARPAARTKRPPAWTRCWP